MGNTGRLRRRKEYLYKKDPNCPECGVEMILPPKGKSSYFPNMATIEHENNKYHPEKRYKKQTKKEGHLANKHRIGRTYLLCQKCNEGKANKETKLLSKEELWKRSGRKPSGVLGKIKGIMRTLLNQKLACYIIWGLGERDVS